MKCLGQEVSCEELRRQNSLKNGFPAELETNIVKIKAAYPSEYQSLKNISSEKQKEDNERQIKSHEIPNQNLLRSVSTVKKHNLDTLSTLNSTTNLRSSMSG